MIKTLFILMSFLIMSIANAAIFNPNTIADLYTAINTANGNGQDDIINLAKNTTYKMTGTAFDIESNITINGNGALLDGNNTSRIFSVVSAGILTLNNMTLTNGLDKGISNAVGYGGAITSEGTLIINRVLFTNNHAEGGESSGNGADAYGGAIYHSGISYCLLTNSTFSGNSAIGANGGIGSNLNSGGWASGSAIYNGSTSEVILQNVTITDNRAQGGSSGPQGTNGIASSALFNKLSYLNENTITLRNSIIAGNIADVVQDCNNYGVWIANTNNLFGGDGTECHAGSSDLTVDGNANGNLANVIKLVLTDNGGSSHTHALVSGSPAINAGNNNNAPAVDQRGYPRDTFVDIGAYEYLFAYPGIMMYLLD